jgi:hypothetical protein
VKSAVGFSHGGFEGEQLFMFHRHMSMVLDRYRHSSTFRKYLNQFPLEDHAFRLSIVRRYGAEASGHFDPALAHGCGGTAKGDRVTNAAYRTNG